MSEEHDKTFRLQRDEAFDRVIILIEGRVTTLTPAILPRFDEINQASLRTSAEREAWLLLLNGVRHLKNGAPDGQPGSMTEALSRASLRSGKFAAGIGVKPPQFEQMLFSVNFTTGHEATLFFCRRLAEAAEGDLAKSRQIVQQKIQAEIPSGAFSSPEKTEDLELKKIFDALQPPILAGRTKDTLPPHVDKEDLSAFKRQMFFSFNVLAETYEQVCGEFKAALLNIPPPLPPRLPGKSFTL